jgi:hypothetical protein
MNFEEHLNMHIEELAEKSKKINEGDRDRYPAAAVDEFDGSAMPSSS